MEATTIDTLEIRVSADAKQATASLNKLVKTLTQLSTVQNNAKLDITTGYSKERVFGLNLELNKLWTLLQKIKKNSNIKINASYTWSSDNTPFAESAEFGSDVVNPTKGTKKTPAIKKGMDWKKFAAIFKDPKTIKGVSKFGELFTSLKRIAMYRILRSIIKAISTAFKEGIKSLYAYSKEYGTEFAKSMDKFATSMSYLKNSLVASFEPLIIALIPLIDTLVDKLVDLMEGMSVLMNQLVGSNTWTRAIKSAKEYNAEIKKMVLGFDELNKMGDTANPLEDFKTSDITANDLKEAGKSAGILGTLVSALAGIGLGKTGFNIMKLLGLEGLSTLTIPLGITLAGGSLTSAILNEIDNFQNGLETDNLIRLGLETIGFTLGGYLIGGPVGGIIGGIVSGVNLVVASFIDAFTNELSWKDAILSTTGFTTIGALIGTAIAPGAGTAIGAVIGFLVGAISNLIIELTTDWQGFWDAVDIEVAKQKDQFIAALNWISRGLEEYLNKWVDRINWFIEVINKIPGIDIPLIAHVEFEEIESGYYDKVKDEIDNRELYDRIKRIEETGWVGDIEKFKTKTPTPRDTNEYTLENALTKAFSNVANNPSGDIILNVYNENTLSQQQVVGQLYRFNKREGATIVPVYVNR